MLVLKWITKFSLNIYAIFLNAIYAVIFGINMILPILNKILIALGRYVDAVEEQCYEETKDD